MPFCPECGTEYRPGFSRCSDCEVALTDTPQTLVRRPLNIRLVVVYSGLAALILVLILALSGWAAWGVLARYLAPPSAGITTAELLHRYGKPNQWIIQRGGAPGLSTPAAFIYPRVHQLPEARFLAPQPPDEWWMWRYSRYSVVIYQGKVNAVSR